MKKYILTFIACLSFLACVKERVKSYCLITYSPPTIHERYGKFVASEPSVSIKNLKEYESDSIAIAAETERMNQYFEGIPKIYEKEMQRIKTKYKDSEFQDIHINTCREIFDDLAKSEFTLLILTHDSGFDKSELLQLVEKEGCLSTEVSSYCMEHNVEFRFVSLN